MKSSSLGLSLATRLARLYLSNLGVTFTGMVPKIGIIALWHQDLAAAMKAFSRNDIRVLLSPSRDGEIAARVAKGLGYEVWRGSSSRSGTSGLRALLRSHSGEPKTMGMALDGPRGPKFQIKPGTLWLSQTLDLPIYPVGVAYRRYFTLEKSWDTARLPWPILGHSLVYLGDPIWEGSESVLVAAMDQSRAIANHMLLSNSNATD